MAKTAGILYVIAAPSGTGKTTLVTALTETIPHLTVSISHTTRPKRPHEIPGVNYYFIDKATFEHMKERGDFLEYANIFNHDYGTSRRFVEETLANGDDVILEIDWQGHQQIKRLCPDAISIFILPPSLKDLKERLIKRNQDKSDIIQIRLADVKKAVSYIHEFDYVVINDDFTKALSDLTTIIHAGRLLEPPQAIRFAPLLLELLEGKA